MLGHGAAVPQVLPTSSNIENTQEPSFRYKPESRDLNVCYKL